MWCEFEFCSGSPTLYFDVKKLDKILPDELDEQGELDAITDEPVEFEK